MTKENKDRLGAIDFAEKQENREIGQYLNDLLQESLIRKYNNCINFQCKFMVILGNNSNKYYVQQVWHRCRPVYEELYTHRKRVSNLKNQIE